jgi:acyl-CoA thioesterase II
MSDLADLLTALDLERTGETSFRGTHLDEGHGVVFGGQLLAQSIVAATTVVPDKELLSFHTVFARGGAFDQPLDIDVEILQSGRSMSSVTVTTRQERGPCTHSVALLHAPDEDRIRHAEDAPRPIAAGPDDVARSEGGAGFWEMRIVDGVDIIDPERTGPPELQVWSRFPGAPDDLPRSQAMLAYSSDGFLIATAMRPHPGIGQSMAHVSVATTVLTQTLTFHEPFTADQWLLLDQRSTYAGRGRSHGVAEVFDTDGRMVASFTQDNMIRGMPQS